MPEIRVAARGDFLKRCDSWVKKCKSSKVVRESPEETFSFAIHRVAAEPFLVIWGTIRCKLFIFCCLDRIQKFSSLAHLMPSNTQLYRNQALAKSEGGRNRGLF